MRGISQLQLEAKARAKSYCTLNALQVPWWRLWERPDDLRGVHVRLWDPANAQSASLRSRVPLQVRRQVAKGNPHFHLNFGITTRVIRLDCFFKVLSTNFLTKVGQIFANFGRYFETFTLQYRTAVATFWATFWKKWSTIYSAYGHTQSIFCRFWWIFKLWHNFDSTN